MEPYKIAIAQKLKGSYFENHTKLSLCVVISGGRRVRQI